MSKPLSGNLGKYLYDRAIQSWHRELTRDRILEIADIAMTPECAVAPFLIQQIIDCLLRMRRVSDQCQDAFEEDALDACDDLCQICEAQLIELRGLAKAANIPGSAFLDAF